MLSPQAGCTNWLKAHSAKHELICTHFCHGCHACAIAYLIFRPVFGWYIGELSTTNSRPRGYTLWSDWKRTAS